MAQGDFDYDLLNYDVVEHTEYAANYSSHYHGSAYYDPWCYASVVRRTTGRPSASRSPSVGRIGATTTTRTSTPIIRSTTRSSTILITTLRPITPTTSIRDPYGYYPYGGGGYGPYHYGNSYTPYGFGGGFGGYRDRRNDIGQ